jgi:uncharacterized protein (TIGR03067 family)
MRKHIVLIQLLVVVILSVVPVLAATPSDDRNAIVGVWSGGMPGDPPGSIELTITPTKVSGRNARTGKSLGVGTYEINPSAKTIDSHGIEAPVKGRKYLGVYSLDGDVLKWCANSRSKNRPKDVVHRPDRDQWLMVLRRQK